MDAEYTYSDFNEVDGMTAVCLTKHLLNYKYPELTVGATYRISRIAVSRSYTDIMLDGFGHKEFNAGCFDIYEDDQLAENIRKDPRFFATSFRDFCKKLRPKFLTEATETISIPAHLKHIERKFGVKILYAVESGSRAWGFESADSDWDVRFIYVHRPEWYFCIKKQRDVIEHIFGDNVDLAGWELRKALEMVRRGNPQVFEWLNSPKIYYADEVFLQRIGSVAPLYFNPLKAMYHYTRIYQKYNERYLQNGCYTAKRFLYYLRGVLACCWIELNYTLPPVAFSQLVDAVVEDSEQKSKIERLIELKKCGNEGTVQTVDSKLMLYARQQAAYFDKRVGTFRPAQNRVQTDALDSILFDMVQSHWQQTE